MNKFDRMVLKSVTEGKRTDYEVTLEGEDESKLVFSEIYNEGEDLIGEVLDNCHNELEMLKCVLIGRETDLTDDDIMNVLKAMEEKKNLVIPLKAL